MNTMKRLVIEPRLCKGCGICVAFCPKNALELKNQKAVLAQKENCILCGMCETLCPDFAVYIERSNRPE